MTRTLLTLAGLGLVVFGCKPREKSALERGASVYARSCATCHGLGKMPGRQRGFSVKPPNLADPELLSRLSDEDLRRTVIEGKGEMPAFGRMMSDEELSQLVVYLRSLSAPAGSKH